MAAHPLLGRCWSGSAPAHVDVPRGGRDRALVRRAARPGQRRAHRGRGDRAAAVPAVPRVAGREPRLALRGDRQRRPAPCSSSRSCCGGSATTRGPGPHRLRSTGRRAGEHKAPLPCNPARMAVDALRVASRRGVFWLLVGSFAVCGASTNGLVGTHFIPAAHDHGMPQTAARRSSRWSGSSTSSGRSSRAG